MKNPLSKLFSQLRLKQADGKKPTKTGYFLIIGLIGILLLLISSIFSPSEQNENFAVMEEKNGSQADDQETFLQKNEESSKNDAIADLEAGYREELTGLLDEIQGVSEVEVMVNLDSTKQQIYEKNLVIGRQKTNETDQNGGERTLEDSTEEQQVVLVRQGDKEVPLLVHTKKPEVRGVLVVAKGVDHLQVKQWVIEAVSRVLDVPVHKVSVMPKN